MKKYKDAISKHSKVVTSKLNVYQARKKVWSRFHKTSIYFWPCSVLWDGRSLKKHPIIFKLLKKWCGGIITLSNISKSKNYVFFACLFLILGRKIWNNYNIFKLTGHHVIICLIVMSCKSCHERLFNLIWQAITGP